MNQTLLDLYSNSTTSREAALSMRPYTSGLRVRVFSRLWASEGLTCAELEEQMNLAHQTASARLRELAQMGAIRDSGERRLTPSGRSAIVWEVI